MIALLFAIFDAKNSSESSRIPLPIFQDVIEESFFIFTRADHLLY